MPRITAFLISSLLFVTPPAFAQTALLKNSAPPAIQSKVGVAAGVSGQVKLDRGSAVGQVVESGTEIYLGDKISTDGKGSLQILLLDQTTFTIGPNSAIVVDQFIYDPSTDSGKVAVRVVEGTFRFITGKIAHKNPENMQVDLPNGTIGIRGTMVMGRVSGTKSFIILTGPGDKNNTGSRRGEIIVGGGRGGNDRSVRISKTGFGTEIEGDNAPQTPFQVPPEQLQEINGELSSESEDQGSEGESSSEANSEEDGSGGEDASVLDESGQTDSSGGESEEPAVIMDDSVGDDESATDLAGQGEIDVGGDLEAMDSFFELGEDSGDLSEDASQDFADDFSDFYDNFTTIDQLALVPGGGISRFEALGVPLYDDNGDSAGTFDVHYDIDFGARTIGGAHSNIQGEATNNFAAGDPFRFNLPSQNFDDGSGGFASYSYQGITDSMGCATCTADVYIDLYNANAEIASEAFVYVALDDTGHPADAVDGFAVAPRFGGATPS